MNNETPIVIPKIVPNPIYSSLNGLLNGTAQSNLVSAHSVPEGAQQVAEQSSPSEVQVGAGPPLPPFFFFLPLASTRSKSEMKRSVTKNAYCLKLSL